VRNNHKVKRKKEVREKELSTGKKPPNPFALGFFCGLGGASLFFFGGFGVFLFWFFWGYFFWFFSGVFGLVFGRFLWFLGVLGAVFGGLAVLGGFRGLFRLFFRF